MESLVGGAKLNAL